MWEGQEGRERYLPLPPSRDAQELEGISTRMDVTILFHKEAPGGPTATVMREDHQGLPADPQCSLESPGS